MTGVSLVMIVRDEERCLARALASVAPVVDEMLVVDTGSTDKTVTIALEHGARVEHFTWRDDFAVARNAALSWASHPWRLILDADEWIESGGETLRQWVAGEPETCGTVVRQDGYLLGSRRMRTPVRIPRVLPRGAYYVGRIHEQVAPSALPRRPTGIVLGHDGYLPEVQTVKSGRNEELLRVALSQEGDDGYLLFKLGNDLEVQGRLAEAIDAYRRADLHTDDADSWSHALIVRQASCLTRSGDARGAVELLASRASSWSQSPDFHFVYGNALLDLAALQPGQADRILPLAATAWDRCLQIGDRPDLPGSVDGRGSHLARHNLQVLANSGLTAGPQAVRHSVEEVDGAETSPDARASGGDS